MFFAHIHLPKLARRGQSRYLRGSNSLGFSAKTLRIAVAVMARRAIGLSMLILQTADFAALSCSSECRRNQSLPSNCSICFVYSCGNEKNRRTISRGVFLQRPWRM